jgi:S1-C subfamily serine protease
MKKLYWLGLSLLLASSARAGLSAEDIYEKISPSVLTLEVENFRGEKFVGSAFLSVRPGLAVTAWHVVHDAKEIQARFPGNKPVKVLGLVGKDEGRDLAFLEIESTKEPDMKLATVAPRVGTKVFVIGAPQGMDFSIADGLVSQLRDVDGMRQYQLSCPISPGNSGGPVLNDNGEIVGVISWRRADAQNMSFAVPALEVTRLQPSKTATVVAVGAFADDSTKVHAEQVVAKRKSTSSGLSDFQKALSNRAGQKVTVTLKDGSGQEEFTFEAPKKAGEKK